MTFDSLVDVENFYKDYAHDAGFSVRIDQQNKSNEEIVVKRFYCLREGYIERRSQRRLIILEKRVHIM
jgi:hypothetical protein